MGSRFLVNYVDNIKYNVLYFIVVLKVLMPVLGRLIQYLEYELLTLFDFCFILAINNISCSRSRVEIRAEGTQPRFDNNLDLRGKDLRGNEVCCNVLHPSD